MKYKLYLVGALTVLGLGVGSYLGLLNGPFKSEVPKTSNSTHLYTTNLDKKNEGYDDLVVRKNSGDIEFYLKDEGNFTNIQDLKKKELSDLVDWHNEESRKIKENYDGIRSKLNSN